MDRSLPKGRNCAQTSCMRGKQQYLASCPSALRGFTLIELLVVIAIIALLISILLPSLQAARNQAKAVVCGAHLRGLSTGLAAYATESKDYIPGVNTSGVSLRTLKQRSQSAPELLANPKLPVQSYDWISPILNMEGGATGNRAERFQYITEKYACPSQIGIQSVPYWDNAASPDKADFDKVQEWTALSYLMPVAFQHWGQEARGRVLASVYDAVREPVTAVVSPSHFSATPKSYVSKIGSVGPPAKKIAAADGTRYVTAGGILDHDLRVDPDLFGSFTSSGGWWQGDTAWGVGKIPGDRSLNWSGGPIVKVSPSSGLNLQYSYRHGKGGKRVVVAQKNKGEINAMYFDGHVDRLSDRASRSVEFWYPTGSKINTGNEGMTAEVRNTLVP